MSTDLQSVPTADLPTEEPAGAITLDPFGYVPNWISRVVGLGGHEPGTDPDYVFHTPYVDCGDSVVLFAIQFHDLEATRGTLTMRVHMYNQLPGAGAVLADVSQISLRDLAVTGEPAMIRIVARPGMLYAVWGTIGDATDARASGLSITLDRRGDASPDAARLAEARRSAFGAPTIRPVPQLVSATQASLADPVSQMCTAAQFDEPLFAEWLSRLKMPPSRDPEQWELVYILQSLRRYGMLEPRARGLGFGCGREVLPAAMAAMGTIVVATDLPVEDDRAAPWIAAGRHAAAIGDLRYPEICAEDGFATQVSFVAVDPTAIPADLTDFDFLWSRGVAAHLGSIAAGLQFIEDSIRCLKPGGLAVHTLGINLSSIDRTCEEGPNVLFRRKDFERLALLLISGGHEVAQVKFDAGDRELGSSDRSLPADMAVEDYEATSFGMIVRRGLR